MICCVSRRLLAAAPLRVSGSVSRPDQSTAEGSDSGNRRSNPTNTDSGERAAAASITRFRARTET